MANITRNETLPDSADKADFHDLVDTAEVTNIGDVDDDTLIQCEESSDEDKIRFDIGGTETVVFGDGTNEELALFTNAGTADALKISQNGVLAASQYALYIYSNATQNAAPLVYFNQDGASSDQNVLLIHNDGSGECIHCDHDNVNTVINIDGDGDSASQIVGVGIDVDNAGAGDQVALNIVLVDESKSYFAKFANATTAWAGEATLVVGTNAPASWLKIKVGATAFYIPYWAAS